MTKPASVVQDFASTFAIITTEAATRLAAIHERMPVIVPRESWALWLDPDASSERARALLRPFPSERLHAYPVSPRVGSHTNDDAACIAPLA
jgi:putative SOS response-associated peptidase YedK